MNSSNQQPLPNPIRAILQLEGIPALSVALAAYASLHGNWWLFAALFLLPDISFLGYLVNPRVGAIAYNALHTYTVPLLIGLIAYAKAPQLMPFACIWVAHIGFDRALGYGLKYSSGFGHTHLSTR